MKHFKHFILLALLFCSTTASAYDFMVDGIAYNINSDGESVEVTYTEYSSDSNYNGGSGSLVIPEAVTYCDKDYTVTSIGEYAFYHCSRYTGALTIPNSVTSIGEHAFSDCGGLTGSLIIPNSVTEIGLMAFSNCTGFSGTLTIGNSVTKIGNYAFYKCSKLTGSLTIPNSVTEIGSNAFDDCIGFTGSLTIGNSVTKIGDWAFSDCKRLTGSLTIPNSVTEIGVQAFEHCWGLTGSLIIPSTVTKIWGSAFYDCGGLTVIKVEDGNNNYDSRDNCNALIETTSNTLILGCMNTTIPNSVTSIERNAFYGCSGLTGSLTIPNSVISIGDRAFHGCKGLTSLTIGNSVISIGERAFWLCDNLSTINSLNPVPPTCASDNVFMASVYNTAELYVPKEDNAIERYTTDEIWSKFNLIYEKDFSPSTSINEITVDTTPTKDVYYNLNGQRVINPSNGIFIHNGKKVIIR